MPEGDTIYRIAQNLRKALGGKTVTRFETRSESVAAVDARRPVMGRTVHAVEARGKHLLMVFRSSEPSEPVKTPERLQLDLLRYDLVLHTHLRMTGSWHIYRPGQPWQKPERLALVTVGVVDYVAPCFSAPVVELLTPNEAARHPDLAALGPDTMTETFDPAEARSRMRKRPDLPIGVALMNQRVMAGVGNVYKSDVLFLQRVSPFARVADLPDDTLDRLIRESHRLMRLNATSTGRRTMFALDASKKLWVYGRSGKPCRVCGEPITMVRQGVDARSTYYCPRCQSVRE